MTSIQERLLYITGVIVRRDLGIPKLRGVTAYWKDEEETAYLTFYFDGEASEDEKEEASDICGGIIAQFSNGFFE